MVKKTHLNGQKWNQVVCLSIMASLISLVLVNPLSFADEIRYSTNAREAVIYEPATQTVLFGKNHNEKMIPSSLTKMMTVYLIFEALKEGSISLSDRFEVSKKAWKQGGSRMFVEPGSKVAVEELIKGTLASSGNDSTVVLAEGLSGSVENFVGAMNRKAKSLKLSHTQFKNPTGWPEEGHYSTAMDMAMLADATIKDFPEYYKKYYSLKQYSYNNIRQKNLNPALFDDIGGDGLKTGRTEAGGFGVASSIEKDGRRLIYVINGLETDRMRRQSLQSMVRWSFHQFKTINIASKGEALGSLPVQQGVEPQVEVVLGKDVQITLSKQDQLPKFTVYPKTNNAPLSAGQLAGVLRVSNLSVQKSFEIPMYVKSSVDRSGVIARSWNWLQSLWVSESKVTRESIDKLEAKMALTFEKALTSMTSSH